MEKAKKTGIVEKYRINDKDCGSAQVQIALLTGRIMELSEHLKTHKKDNHGRHGLLLMVGQRKRLSTYLKRKDKKAYAALAESLGIK